MQNEPNPKIGHFALRLMAGITLSLLSGAIAALSTSYKLWYWILFAFVPMLIAQHRVLPPRWSAVAPAIAYSLWFASQILPGLVQARVHLAFQLLPLYVGLIVFAMSRRTRKFHEETGYRWFWIATPVAWVALDFLRGSTFAVLGGTWANPAYVLWPQPWLIQPISITGIYGLELGILLVNWAFAGFFIAPGLIALRSAAITVVLAVTWVTASVRMMDSAPPTVRVAAIQPGPTTTAEQELRNDIEQTREAAAKGARLIVWREAGLRFDPRVERTEEIAALARETGAHLVIGFTSRRPDGLRPNMAAVFAPDGTLIGAYGKDHPGTFAGDFSDVKVGHPTWQTSIGRLAAIICYDLDFTDTARFMAQGGAEIVAVPSNDPVPSLAETHYTHLVFHAVENRISLIKADKMRDAAAIDPWGRVVAKAVNYRGAKSTLVADLPLGTHNTLFVRFGDWPGWLCVATLVITLAYRAATLPSRDRKGAVHG